MTLLVQILLIAAAIGLIVAEVAIVRALVQMRQLAEVLGRLGDHVERSLVRVDRLVDTAQDMVESTQRVVDPIRRASEALGAVGHRAARLSSRVLDELEPPARLATSISQTVRIAITGLVQRVTGGHSPQGRPHNGHGRESGAYGPGFRGRT